MLNEKDRKVVEGMCACGMSLEALYRSFPKFDKNDIKEVFDDYQKSIGNYVEEEINISINCS